MTGKIESWLSAHPLLSRHAIIIFALGFAVGIARYEAIPVYGELPAVLDRWTGALYHDNKCINCGEP